MLKIDAAGVRDRPFVSGALRERVPGHAVEHADAPCVDVEEAQQVTVEEAAARCGICGSHTTIFIERKRRYAAKADLLLAMHAHELAVERHHGMAGGEAQDRRGVRAHPLDQGLRSQVRPGLGCGANHDAQAGDPWTRYGSTNSCCGWCTVSTGHGALRTTFSATLPSSMCATSPRPCVPTTMRSTSRSLA